MKIFIQYFEKTIHKKYINKTEKHYLEGSSF